MSTQLKAVFDCNTLLQAMAAPNGPAGKSVQLALDGKIALYIASFVIAELREVANRPKVAAKLRLSAHQLDAFVHLVSSCATTIVDFPARFIYSRDPDDAMYVNLALAAGAELIVSRDSDLLDLMDETRSESREFQVRFPQLRIVTPVAFLREVESVLGL